MHQASPGPYGPNVRVLSKPYGIAVCVADKHYESGWRIAHVDYDNDAEAAAAKAREIRQKLLEGEHV
jgi:hypothetical protein